MTPGPILLLIRLAVAVGLLLWACGCIWIPTPEHGLLAGRGAVTREDAAFLTTGVTTREESLLRFGEPDILLEGEKVLAYLWGVSHGYFAVGGYGAAVGGPIQKNYLLMMEFDDAGVLRRWDIQGCVAQSPKSVLEKWMEMAQPGSPSPSP